MPDSIDAIIIDDDHHMRAAIYKQAEGIPNLQIVGEAQTDIKGYQLIREKSPDIVFLSMDGVVDGLGLMQRLARRHIKIICSSHNPRMAGLAIRKNALDFILKPAYEKEIGESLHRAVLSVTGEKRHLPAEMHRKFEVFYRGQVFYFRFGEIICFRSHGSYTEVKLINGDRMVISKNLKSIAESLDPLYFFRTHNSCVVNIRLIRKINYSERVCIMDNGDAVPVSARRLDDLRGHAELVWLFYR
ncbi:MAG: hypothetical protein RL226_1001 [Bacteroidota bacterium]